MAVRGVQHNQIAFSLNKRLRPVKAVFADRRCGGDQQAPAFILGGIPEFCPLFPNIDCNTVFQDSLGQEVDPAITDALLDAIAGLTGLQLEPPDILLPD